MRIDGRAEVFRIARQVGRIDAATSIKLGVIDVDLLV